MLLYHLQLYLACFLNNIFLDIFVNYFIFPFLVFSFAFSFEGLDKFLRGNDFTYGIYIYHMFFVNIFVQIGRGGGIYVVYVAILSICCAIISWFFVEKPCLSLKSKSLYRLIQRRKPRRIRRKNHR